MQQDEKDVDLTTQQTQTLSMIAITTAVAFNSYIDRHSLDPITISVISQVRYLTIWNIQHGKPVTRTHAARVRQGVQQLTGVPYTGPIHMLVDC